MNPSLAAGPKRPFIKLLLVHSSPAPHSQTATAKHWLCWDCVPSASLVPWRVHSLWLWTRPGSSASTWTTLSLARRRSTTGMSGLPSPASAIWGLNTDRKLLVEAAFQKMWVDVQMWRAQQIFPSAWPWTRPRTASDKAWEYFCLSLSVRRDFLCLGNQLLKSSACPMWIRRKYFNRVIHSFKILHQIIVSYCLYLQFITTTNSVRSQQVCSFRQLGPLE